MAEKIGRSLVQSGLYEVTIIGYGSSGPPPQELETLSLGRFGRLSVTRWWSRWRVFKMASNKRPTVFIFGTFELIVPALALKVIFGTKVIYDVRENYYLNILHSEALPLLLRWPLAFLVRSLEKLTAPAIDHYFLAEKGYESEFKFHRGGWTVLENKALPFGQGKRQAPASVNLRLLFSGTLAESTGVFRAIALVKRLNHAKPVAHLTIAGYAASPVAQRRIREATADQSSFTLLGIEQLVPHAKILELISQSNAGIIAYPKLPHTQNSVPTKLFEYLSAGLPILTEEHWPWVNRYQSYRPFVFVNFETTDVERVLNHLGSNTLYPTLPTDVWWSSEAAKLLDAVKKIA